MLKCGARSNLMEVYFSKVARNPKVIKEGENSEMVSGPPKMFIL